MARQARKKCDAVAALAPCLDPSVAEFMPGRYEVLPALTRLALAAGHTSTATAAQGRRGRSAPGAAATAALTEALSIYEMRGAEWDIQRAATRLRRLGIRRGARGTRHRPATGWDALTPTEVKVAQLVAGGQSNPDIAAQLVLSRNTVQTHVSHILAKLGARSRAEVAREAALARQPQREMAGGLSRPAVTQPAPPARPHRGEQGEPDRAGRSDGDNVA